MVKLKDIRIMRGDRTFQFSHHFPGNSLTTIVGSSGAGKSTLLEVIAGFLTPQEGHVFIDKIDCTKAPPGRRSVSYMFQHNALFPSLTVESNVALALHDSKQPPATKNDLARSMLKLLGLNDQIGSQKPGQLSGGQLTRANLARTLLRPAKIYLLDEPFAALDREMRTQLIQLTAEFQKRNQVTLLLVTHHPDEVIDISDTILTIEQGTIVCGGKSF